MRSNKIFIFLLFLMIFSEKNEAVDYQHILNREQIFGEKIASYLSINDKLHLSSTNKANRNNAELTHNDYKKVLFEQKKEINGLDHEKVILEQKNALLQNYAYTGERRRHLTGFCFIFS